MNKSFSKILFVAICATVAIAVVAQASGYGYGQQQQGYAPSYGQDYGQNYDRKVGFKTVIYHPYKATSSRFDHRFYPAYGYNPYPAPSIRTGLEYTIGDIPSNQYNSGNQYSSGSSY